MRFLGVLGCVLLLLAAVLTDAMPRDGDHDHHHRNRDRNHEGRHGHGRHCPPPPPCVCNGTTPMPPVEVTSPVVEVTSTVIVPESENAIANAPRGPKSSEESKESSEEHGHGHGHDHGHDHRHHRGCPPLPRCPCPPEENPVVE